MSAFIKSNAVDKEVYCETVYKRFVSETCDFIQGCEGIGNVLSIKLPSGCYTNFRDALFHFRRMCTSFEVNEIARQAFAVEEHSNRAKTDAIICILEYCSLVLQILSHKDFRLSKETLWRLVSVKNKIDSKAMHLRLSGIMLDQTHILRISDDEFQSLLEEFFDFIDHYVGKEEFHDALIELGKGK